MAENRSHGTDSSINLAAVQRVDPSAISIIELATQTALYKFNQNRHEWEKTETEGSMFVYKRADHPLYSFLIINRQKPVDLIEPLHVGLQFRVQIPYLFYCRPDGTIRGLWFYDQTDCQKMAALLNKLVAEQSMQLSVSEQSGRISMSNVDDNGSVMQLLNRAQYCYGTEKRPITVSQVVRPKPLKGRRQSGDIIDEENGMPVMLQMLLTDKKDIIAGVRKGARKQTVSAQLFDNRKTKGKADELFRLNSSSSLSPKSEENYVIDNNSSLDLLQQPIKAPPSLVERVRRGSSSFEGSIYEKDPLLLDEMRSAVAQLSLDDSALLLASANDQLLTPADFIQLSTSSDSFDNGLQLAASALRTQNAVYLTKEQMAQGFIHLLKTDNDFVKRLHEAYVDSLNVSMKSARQ